MEELIESLCSGMKKQKEMAGMKMFYLMHDIKYMSKQKALPTIVHETDFLDKCLSVLRKFYLQDLVEQSQVMEEFDKDHIKENMLVVETRLIPKIRRILHVANYQE